jgi:hypothetical protein
LIHEFFLFETLEEQNLGAFTNNFVSSSTGRRYGGRFGLPPCLILNDAKLPESYSPLSKDFLYGLLQADRALIDDVNQHTVFKIMSGYYSSFESFLRNESRWPIY